MLYEIVETPFTLLIVFYVSVQVKDFPLFVHSKLLLQDYCVNSDSPVLRVTRAGETLFGPIAGDNWTVFVGNHSTYVPLSYAKLIVSPENADQRTTVDADLVSTDAIFAPVMEDRGLYDGIRRILFGSGLDFWLHRLLFIDALSYLSWGQLSQPLDRYVMVDIDDIFVGQPGTRMTTRDVEVSACRKLGTLE